MSDKIEVNRRRVLGGIATVGAASAALGAGTFAFFSDTESSEDNEISSGTISLAVNDGNGFDYTFQGIVPGDSTTVSVDLENSGTVDASDLVVSTSTDAGSDSENLVTQLQIDEVRWDGSSQSVSATTVEELTSNDLQFDASSMNDSPTTLAIDVTFNTNAGNEYQDVSVDIDHTFTLYQNSDQV